MSGIKYEVLAGDDLISALRGGRTGDLLDDAAYAAADEIESLRSRLAEAEADNARLVAANKARDEFLRGHRYKHSEVDGYIDLCESQMADLKAQLAEAERTIAALSGFKP